MNDQERERLAKLEIRVEHAETQLSRVIDDIRKLSVSVSSIDITLHKVYYIVVGAVFVLTAQEFGLLTAIKKMFLL